MLILQEMSAREEAEQRHREAEKRMQQMAEDMERARLELAEAHNTIHSLESQLKQLQLAKQALEQKEYELRELTAQLQSEKAMSDDERRRLRDQVDAREREVYTMREEVERQTTVTRQLQTQVIIAIKTFRMKISFCRSTLNNILNTTAITIPMDTLMTRQLLMMRTTGQLVCFHETIFLSQSSSVVRYT